MLTSKQRLLTAIDRKKPDRLPVTTHHLMSQYLNAHKEGCTDSEFFNDFGLDAIVWVNCAEYNSKDLENWCITSETISGLAYPSIRHTITTPAGKLTTVLQSNGCSTWVAEHLLKAKKDIELLQKYMPSPICNREAVNKIAKENSTSLIRSHIPCFDLFGQPGCWQDAACIYGIEPLIMESYDDPEWVHELLEVLQRRKIDYIKTLDGVNYDIIELGGGDASTTVISPQIFNEFVAPYDSKLIELAHEKGQRIAYHTCGGMMPILEDLAAMKPNALETFTPVDMGGDTDLAQAKRRIGDKVCMIGGFDQFHFFTGCTEEDTRKEVRRCFEEAGEGGGFILSPSDHFFEADDKLIHAFADEAQKCTY